MSPPPRQASIKEVFPYQSVATISSPLSRSSPAVLASLWDPLLQSSKGVRPFEFTAFILAPLSRNNLTMASYP